MYTYIYNFASTFKTLKRLSLTSCDKSLTNENSRKEPQIVAILFGRSIF